MNDQIPAETSRVELSQLQSLDRAHHIHPMTDQKALHAAGVRVITGANGVYLRDAEGNRILDGMAGLWCVNVGYGRQELVDAAARQMQELPYYNCFFHTTNPAATRLAGLLAQVTPSNLTHALFANSGSEANDTVVRVVRTYWQLMGEPDRTVIISRHNAYHGSTIAAASLGGMPWMHRQGVLPIDGIVHIEQPYRFGDGGDLSAEEFGLKMARALEDKIVELGPDRVAAFIAEPVQGSGGVIIPPESYWPEIRRICDRFGILLVADEVICGFGRMGTWFGSDYYALEPDLMSMAKGLSSGYQPIGAVMVSGRVAATLVDKAGFWGHGFTCSGHPVACAVAVRNIEILRDEGIVETVGATTGPYFQDRVRELGTHPLIGEARGVGMLGALEIVADRATLVRFDKQCKAGITCRDRALENGVVVRAIGDTLVVSPPLTISLREIDEMAEKIRRTLDQAAKALQR